MTPHTHREYVEGCYRCDLSRDEVASVARDEALCVAYDAWNERLGLAENLERVLNALTKPRTEKCTDDWHKHPPLYPHVTPCPAGCVDGTVTRDPIAVLAPPDAVERVAAALIKEPWAQLYDEAGREWWSRALSHVALDALYRRTGEGEEAERMKPGWCEFDGTPESCTRLTDWFGGPAAGVARWRTANYDGGWLLNADGSDGAPFAPGDTIIRDGDGYRVESGPAWDARIDAILQRGDELMEEPLDRAIRLLRATRPVLRHHASENPTARNVLSAVAAFLARYEDSGEV